MEWLNILRNELYRELMRYMDDPHGSLLVGILLGLNNTMPYEFYDGLIRTGTIHVTAVSGMNVSLVAVSLLKFSSRIFYKKIAVLISIVGIWAYTLLVGLEASVIRASIMATFAYMAILFGREYRSKWALLVTGVTMLLIVPGMVANLGFWLSITSTAGIIWLSNNLELGVLGIEKKLVKSGFVDMGESDDSSSSLIARLLNALKNDFKTTMAAQLATLPIILLVFGQLSLISPLVNLMIAWLIPYIMVSGFVKLILGSVSPFLGYVMGLVCYIPLEIFVNIIEFFAKFKFISIYINFKEIGVTSLLRMMIGLIYYMMLIVWVIKRQKRG